MEPQAKKARLEHRCQDCNKSFAFYQGLHRHKITAHRGTSFSCPHCEVSVNRKDTLMRHMKRYHPNGGQVGLGETNNTEQLSTPELTPSSTPADGVPSPLTDRNAPAATEEAPCDLQALGGTLRTKTIKASGISKFDPMLFLKNKYEEVKTVLKNAIRERGAVKWYMSMKVKMSRKQGDKTETVEPHFRGKCQTALKWEDLDEVMQESIKKVYSSFIEYQRRGSNWTVEYVVDLTIHMARYRPLRGSSYIPLPLKLRAKRAIINVQNRDRKCFMWSILSALFPVKQNAERISKYKDHLTALSFQGYLVSGQAR